MKLILLFCLILLCNIAFTSSQLLSRFLRHYPPPPNVTERRITLTSKGVFEQKLDHFDSNNTKTWSQKYYVNPDFFTNDGNNIAFLMIGGEGAAAESWMTFGSWVIYAKKYGAILFQLEHRFYGESQPFSNLATENLKFLSSQQALADTAVFIQAMNEQYSLGSDVKWVSFGGSYAGSLSAWLRLKYPDLVSAAVSSSAPLLAQVDYSGYYDVVIDDVDIINKDCIASLKKGMATIDALLTNPNSSEEIITSIFNLCDPIEQYDIDNVNVSNFYLVIADQFAAAATYHGVVENPLTNMCGILIDESYGSEIYRLGQVIKKQGCVSYDYNDDLELMRSTQLGGVLRLWYYQTCTEFGWYQTTNRDDVVLGRGASVEFFTKMCNDVFGPDFDSNFIYNQIDKTNADYLGTEINATNIVFVHGSFDPWHAAGLLKANNEDSPVIYIEGTSHCSDMYEERKNDLPQLNEAREEIGRLIGKWLGYNN